MEKRFVSIWFPWLVTDWICTRRPELKEKPLVVSAASHGRLIIRHLNAHSAAAGIQKGMALADARAIVPGLEAMNERPGLAEKLIDRIALWCIRFTPMAATDLPDGVMLDATGCTHLWNGDENYLRHIKARLSQKGYAARIGMAPTPGAAWAAARFGNDNSVIPSSELLNTIIQYPPESLRIPGETISLLYRLGLKKLSAFIHMPRSVLRNRFGKDLNDRIAQMVGSKEEFIVPRSVPAEFSERLFSFEPIQTRKGIELALEKTLDGLVPQLAKKGLGIRELVFRIYRFDGGEQEISIHTGRPTCNKKHLFRLFEERINQVDPGGGIELFILEAKHSEKTNPGQESIWDNTRGTEVDIAEWLDKISIRLGGDRIQRFLPAEHHWPERSFRLAKEPANIEMPEWRINPLRPLELLAQPEQIEVTAPVPDYPPMLFIHRGRVHRVRKADGPERIEREWWLDEGTHRDYYALEDEEGSRFWVYRSGHYQATQKSQWFLCGFFP